VEAFRDREGFKTGWEARPIDIKRGFVVRTSINRAVLKCGKV
jgi:hypothetical protein